MLARPTNWVSVLFHNEFLKHLMLGHKVRIRQAIIHVLVSLNKTFYAKITKAKILQATIRVLFLLNKVFYAKTIRQVLASMTHRVLAPFHKKF